MYYVGFGWIKVGDFFMKESWEKYFVDFVVCLKLFIIVKIGE